MRSSVVAGLLVLSAGALTAQGPSTQHSTAMESHKVPVPSAIAVRRNGPVVLDAKLDEAAWNAATPITEFTQSDPDEGKPGSERTEVRFLFDDDALYVGARMFDAHGPSGVMTRLVRRDASFDSDFFQIVIDGFHDHLSRAFFEVNPAGSKSDYIGIGTSCCDSGWDPIWEAVTRIDEQGWIAEIRIPYSQLRFSRAETQTWGLQVRRFIKRRNEEDDWSFWKKNEAGGPSRFGHLEGLRIVSQPAGLELMPYAVAKSSSLAGDVGSPFDTKGRPEMNAGLDLRDRVTTNLTLTATINPDFGQVEVDPAVLNLSAFETFFPEKRPFFVEGSQIFSFGSFSCSFCSNAEGMSAFYSRRVGRAPTGASLTSSFAAADIPDATTILGAAKLTGRTSKGWTVGLLDALTGRANARVQTAAGVRSKVEVEPMANFSVARLKRDFNGGNLVVGGIFSGMQRSIDTTFAPRLAKHAEMIGSDMVWTTPDKKYSFRANAALTDVSGDARVIASRQRSSARYFQRPDRGAGSGGFLSNKYDPSATNLRGLGGYARFAKDVGDWMWEGSMNTRTPGYETNDFAFQNRADYIWSNANLIRFWSKRGSWYQNLFAIVGGQSQWNYEGNRTQTQYHQFFQWTSHSFWNVNQFYIERPRVLDDRQLRGGPLVEQLGSHFAELDVSSDSRHAIRGDGSFSYYWDERGGWSPNFSIGATYRPASNVSVSFNPSFGPSRSMTQYVTSVTDPTASNFYGTRYVLATIDQRTLGLDTRVSWTFSPTMTLEVYAQPFFASGHYFDFKEFAKPRGYQLQVYGKDKGTITTNTTAGAVTSYTIDPDGAGPAASFNIGNPDFSDHSLRGNTVFRWEYRPGSVLYVAWTQSRFGEDPFGDLQFSRDRQALFATKPDNIFLIKASWWLSR